MSFPNILSLILQINIIQSQYNYLCDFKTNFISNDRGNWSFDAANCAVTQTNTDSMSPLYANGAVAWMGGQNDTLFWTDYTIEATINAASGGDNVVSAGIIFRVQADGVVNNGGDVGDFYEAMLIYWSTYRVHLREYTKSGYIIIKQNNAASCSYNTDYVLRIEVTGYYIYVYLDNVLQFSRQTSYLYPAGSVGIRATYTYATFKTLYITFPSIAPTIGTPTIATDTPTTVMPTTSMPTTSMPTTSTPTTYAPTTYAPTTDIPTTFAPTTFTPTVTRTGLSTTKYETTSEPTTISTISTENEMKTSMNINNATNGWKSWNSILIIVTLAVIIVFVASVITVLLRCYKNKKYVKKHEIALQMQQMNKTHVIEQVNIDCNANTKDLDSNGLAAMDEEDNSHSHSVEDMYKNIDNVTVGQHATKQDVHNTCIDDGNSSTDEMYNNVNTKTHATSAGIIEDEHAQHNNAKEGYTQRNTLGSV